MKELFGFIEYYGKMIINSYLFGGAYETRYDRNIRLRQQ